MPREQAPPSPIPDLKDRVYAFAEEHGLIVNEDMLKKLNWMTDHGGRCFCDWESDRRCPCHRVFDDIAYFNGSCMCNLLHTPEKNKRWKQRKARKPEKLTDSEIKTRKEKAKTNKKNAEEIFNKMIKKK